jgi:hypothetical protein
LPDEAVVCKVVSLACEAGIRQVEITLNFQKEALYSLGFVRLYREI